MRWRPASVGAAAISLWCATTCQRHIAFGAPHLLTGADSVGAPERRRPIRTPQERCAPHRVPPPPHPHTPRCLRAPLSASACRSAAGPLTMAASQVCAFAKTDAALDRCAPVAWLPHRRHSTVRGRSFCFRDPVAGGREVGVGEWKHGCAVLSAFSMLAQRGRAVSLPAVERRLPRERASPLLGVHRLRMLHGPHSPRPSLPPVLSLAFFALARSLCLRLAAPLRV